MLGNNIRMIRKTKHISINALSKLSTVSLGYLSDLENNKVNNPTLETLNKIADALGIAIEELFKENTSDKRDIVYNIKESNNIKDDDIRRIERARKKMSPKDKKKMMKILEATFEDYFNDES